MKYRAASQWPAPKRGKARSNMKRPATAKKPGKKCPNVPYTRVKGVQTKFRKERARYGVSIPVLTSMTSARLIQKLTQDGILPAWRGSTCPHCAVGRLGPLTYFRTC